AFILLLVVPALASAHPVPRGDHDRTVVVHLQPNPVRNEIEVVVHYRLEVDKLTVVFDDMAPFKDQVKKLGDNSLTYFDEFTRIYGPILAANLIATGDGKALTFTCDSFSCRDLDVDDKPLGHLRCDFVFHAAFGLRPGEIQTLSMREDNY